MAKDQANAQTPEQSSEQTDDPREQMLNELRESEAQAGEQAQPGTETPPQETQTPPETPPAAEGETQAATTGETPEGQPAESETPPQSVEEKLAEALKELGWKGEDPSEAPDVMLDAFKRQASEYQQIQQQLAEQQELARYGTQYLREQRERDEAARAGQASPAGAQQQQPGGGDAQKPDPWWNPPKFDPATLEQYRDVGLGENGQPQVTWKKNTPPEVIENAEAYQRYLDQWATNLVQRPQEVLPQIIEQEFDRLFEERISQRESAANVESFAEQVRETNQDWMYTTDSRGREVLTPEGQQMTQLLSEVAEAGISDPRTQWEYAVARFDYQNRQQEQQSQDSSKQASETAATKRKQHVDKGSGRQPQNRGGTVPKPEESNTMPQNPNLSPGQQLIEMMRQRGEEMW